MDFISLLTTAKDAGFDTGTIIAISVIAFKLRKQVDKVVDAIKDHNKRIDSLEESVSDLKKRIGHDTNR